MYKKCFVTFDVWFKRTTIHSIGLNDNQYDKKIYPEAAGCPPSARR